jgi:hypothetical protein
MEFKRTRILGWLAAGISAIFANVWAFWGINENFHEGWYCESFWSNVLMMFGQYLLMPLGFVLLAVASIRWHRAGGILHVLLAIGAYLLFGTSGAGLMMVALPLAGLGLLYWFGELEHKRLAYVLIVGLPLLQTFGFGTYHAIRVANRYSDGNYQTRVVEGNGVTLVWAPQGPGWPDNGTTWEDAMSICAHLNEDATAVEDTVFNIWRLPTVDEAVRSAVYHGINAGGTWDSVAHSATYKKQPDKESPLWNGHLKTIYWWTSTSMNEKEAYIIVFNGGVYPRRKVLRADYLNFRAVKEVQ